MRLRKHHLHVAGGKQRGGYDEVASEIVKHKPAVSLGKSQSLHTYEEIVVAQTWQTYVGAELLYSHMVRRKTPGLPAAIRDHRSHIIAQFRGADHHSVDLKIKPRGGLVFLLRGKSVDYRLYIQGRARTVPTKARIKPHKLHIIDSQRLTGREKAGNSYARSEAPYGKRRIAGGGLHRHIAEHSTVERHNAESSYRNLAVKQGRQFLLALIRHTALHRGKRQSHEKYQRESHCNDDGDHQQGAQYTVD